MLKSVGLQTLSALVLTLPASVTQAQDWTVRFPKQFPEVEWLKTHHRACFGINDKNLASAMGDGVKVVIGFENRRVRISGTRGTIDADLSQSSITIIHRDPSRIENVTVPSGERGHGGADSRILTSFVEFVRGHAVRSVTPRAAAVGVRIGIAAQRSCDESRLVALDS